MLVILLRLCLWVARLWKYFEFLSLPIRQKDFSHYLHILFSFKINSFTSLFNSLTRRIQPEWIANCSALFSILLFSINSCLTFPKCRLLHYVSLVPHFSTFLITCILGSQWIWSLHTALTMWPQPLSKSHISSNLNGLEKTGASKPFGTIQRGIWIEVLLLRWKTLVAPNYCSQSFVQKVLSNLSQINWPLAKCFFQVNFEPE